MSDYPVRVVAVAEIYPTEADARHALATELAPGIELGAYLGLWRMPIPEATVVHLFTDAEEDWLIDSGWKRARIAEGSGDREAPDACMGRTADQGDPTV